MKRVFEILTLAMLISLVMAGCPQEAPEEFTMVDNADLIEDEPQVVIEEAGGEPAPDFTVPLAGGGEASLSDYEGRILVLDFWATWCTACVRELPDYQDLHDRWAENEVQYLGMSLDSEMGLVEAFLDRREDLTLQMALAPEETIEAYLGARRTLPASRVIDASGVIRYEFQGPATEKVGYAVDLLLAESRAGSDDAH